MKKINKRKSVVSPIILTVGLLAVWVVGLVLGNVANVLISRFVIEEQGRNFWIVIVYIAVAIVVGVSLAFFITHLTMNVLSDINENVNKIAEGDFTARLTPITKNPHINSAVYNFNEMVKQLNSVAVLKNDFISSFTHEFNTPVSSIKGFAELLDGAENLTKEQKEYVKIIIEESKSLSMLAENTMKLARLDSQTIITEKKEFSLDGQLQECVLLFDNKLKEKNIEVEIFTLSARIKNDPYLIKEIWINLISNAIKYSEKGSKITVTLTKENGRYKVAIKDQGVGISEENLKKIFDKFYQTEGHKSRNGLGLGLSIVKRVCELVNAEISVESELGKGTVFTVIL